MGNSRGHGRGARRELAELHERLFADAWRTDLRRHRSSLAFRGRTDADEDLRTSLARLSGDTGALEGQLLRYFRVRGPGCGSRRVRFPGLAGLGVWLAGHYLPRSR